MTDEGFVWLEFPATGGRQRFSVASAEAWRARGWVDCEPPAEPDRLHDPLPEAAPEPAEPSTDQPEPGGPADTSATADTEDLAPEPKVNDPADGWADEPATQETTNG